MYFTAADAVRLSGVGRAMLDYLCRTDVIRPTLSVGRGRGKARRFAFADIVMLRVLAKLLKAGVSVSRMKRALAALRRYHPEISPTSLPASHLVTDGKAVYLKDSSEVLEDLQTGQHAFAFIIELGRVRTEVMDKIDFGGLEHGNRLRRA
jgi:DNA-binding transcriptional MerR regulator